MHSECPEEIFEHFSLKKRCFLKDFLTLSEKVPDFVKNLRQGLRNFNLRVRRKILRQKKTEKMLNFQWFCILSKKIGLWSNQFRRVRQSCIQSVQRNLLSLFHWKNDDFWLIFAHWAKKFRTLPNIYGRVFETSIYVSGEKFWEKKLKKCWFFSNFYFWVKKMDFGQINSAGFVKAAFGVSRGTFWAFFIEKTTILEWFSHFEQKVPDFAKHLRQGFRNVNLRVRRKVLREKNFEKMTFS